MSQLTKEVEEAIKKNLSSEVAGTLKDFIEEAEDNKDLIEDLKKQNESRRVSLEILYTEKLKLKTELESVTKELDEYKAREDVTRNAELRIVHAGFEAQKAQAVAETYKSCFEIVFRNGQVKRQIIGHENLPSTYSSGNGQSSTSPVQMPINKTTTEEDIG